MTLSQHGSWRGRALLGLFVFAACRKPPPPAPPPQPIAAVVDGAPIPLAKVQAELDRLRRSSAEIAGEGESQVADAGAPEEAPKLGRALLEGLIDRALVLARARATGVTVSDAELQKALEGLPGADPDELRERLLAEKYIAGETRRENASPEEAAAYFDTHRSEWQSPEAVHCLQIAARSPDEAKSALDQLRRGAQFEEVARKMSSSPDAARGGDLGFFSRGTMPKAFDDACFSLGTGKLSGVVQSPYGFHVFKLLARRPARQRKLDDVRADVTLRATAEKRAQAERALIAQLRSSAQIHVDAGTLQLLR